MESKYNVRTGTKLEDVKRPVLIHFNGDEGDKTFMYRIFHGLQEYYQKKNNEQDNNIKKTTVLSSSSSINKDIVFCDPIHSPYMKQMRIHSDPRRLAWCRSAENLFMKIFKTNSNHILQLLK